MSGGLLLRPLCTHTLRGECWHFSRFGFFWAFNLSNRHTAVYPKQTTAAQQRRTADERVQSAAATMSSNTQTLKVPDIQRRGTSTNRVLQFYMKAEHLNSFRMETNFLLTFCKQLLRILWTVSKGDEAVFDAGLLCMWKHCQSLETSEAFSMALAELTTERRLARICKVNFYGPLLAGEWSLGQLSNIVSMLLSCIFQKDPLR